MCISDGNVSHVSSVISFTQYTQETNNVTIKIIISLLVCMFLKSKVFNYYVEKNLNHVTNTTESDSNGCFTIVLAFIRRC